MYPQLFHFEDPLHLEFEAVVLEKLRLPDGRPAVILDHTYFYPTGGGQEHDTGSLGEARVVDVFKDAPEGPLESVRLVHVIDREISFGPVKASIDAERRQRHMQHHTAQHLLSHCFVHLLNLETVSANINGYSPSTLDLIGGEPGQAELVQVEDLANQIIFEDRLVKSYFVTPAQLHTVPLRKPPSVHEDIRIVEIDGLDYSACGGTHCLRTGVIGIVKILKTERQKDRTRIHFIAGSQALVHYRQANEIVAGLAAQMSIHPQDLAATVLRQSEQLRTAQKELQLMQQEMLVLEARQLVARSQAAGSRRLVVASFDHRPAGELRALANELRKMDGVVAMLAGFDGSKVSLIVACAQDSGTNAQELLKGQLAQLGGRGGGDAGIAQGGAAATEEQYTAFCAALRDTLGAQGGTK
jgi:alanyl-tRNA synthetase